MCIFLIKLRAKKVQIKSPVTLSGHAVKVYQFDNNRIKQQYAGLNMDVSRFIDGRDISLWECSDTGYRFYHPFDIFGDGLFYEELQQKHPWYYKEGKYEHHRALQLIAPGSKVLEIGSGSGYFLGLCSEKGIDATGLEFNDEAISKCRAKGLRVEKQPIADFADQNPESFDVVCFFQVLEHISDVAAFVTDALRALKKGGKLIIAVPNNNPFIFRHDVYHTLNLPPHHAGLWSRKAFEQLPRFFPIRLHDVFIEPMTEYKTWFLAQREHHRGTWKGFLLSLLPRPVYKMAVRVASSQIEGRNIMVVFEKS